MNRSITDDAKRDEIRRLLLWLASRLDEDSLDHQLLTLKYELNAALSEDFAESFLERAESLNAAKSEVEREE